MSVSIGANFLTETQRYFDQLPQVSAEAAALSINQVTERTAIPLLRKDALSQIAFPSGYLNDDRLSLASRANPANLRAVIKGRDRPTSLARFAAGQTPENSRRRQLVVQVGRGRTIQLKKAFLVRLKNGNIGLAIRLKPGQKPDSAYKPVALDNGVWLLYGPSVDQVIKSVFEDSVPAIGTALSNEFFRQFIRLSNRG